MGGKVRVMVEQGRKKPVFVACAFDWPGWDRRAKTEGDALAVLESYRPRYLKVAEIAGLADEFRAAGDFEVVERVQGAGMTDYYGVSMVTAAPEREPMSGAECERKVALLEATWAYFDQVASKVSAELRRGPRGGGRDRDQIIRHTNGAEIEEFAKKVGVVTPEEVWRHPEPVRLRAYRREFSDAIRDYSAREAPARSWALQFLIRRCAWHMLDHAWEMEDKDLSGAA